MRSVVPGVLIHRANCGLPELLPDVGQNRDNQRGNAQDCADSNTNPLRSLLSCAIAVSNVAIRLASLPMALPRISGIIGAVFSRQDPIPDELKGE